MGHHWGVLKGRSDWVFQSGGGEGGRKWVGVDMQCQMVLGLWVGGLEGGVAKERHICTDDTKLNKDPFFSLCINKCSNKKEMRAELFQEKTEQKKKSPVELG
uniref:Uncharacterized protein n=1 Tax=Sphaerodactylus townsendi TaxID=933632 RepID=A0ACB8FUD7_9SAUR